MPIAGTRRLWGSASITFRSTSSSGAGGSRKYEKWVLQLLGLKSGGPETWTGDDHFEVTLAESPWEMENILRGELQEGRCSH